MLPNCCVDYTCITEQSFWISVSINQKTAIAILKSPSRKWDIDKCKSFTVLIIWFLWYIEIGAHDNPLQARLFTSLLYNIKTIYCMVPQISNTLTSNSSHTFNLPVASNIATVRRVARRTDLMLWFRNGHSFGINWTAEVNPSLQSTVISISMITQMAAWHPIQYEHAPLWVRCAMLRKHPPVDPVLSCLSCFRKPSIGVCQVINNSPDPGIAWPSARFPPDLWRWFEKDTASIRRLIHSGYMAKRERRWVLTIEESGMT